MKLAYYKNNTPGTCLQQQSTSGCGYMQSVNVHIHVQNKERGSPCHTKSITKSECGSQRARVAIACVHNVHF